MSARWFSLALLFVLSFSFYCTQSDAAVISIDFGSEWIKVALVKPGVPMEIVLNKESKRKTAAVVSMRNNERLFGDAALTSAIKYPKTAYRYLQLLLGQKMDSPIVRKYQEWFPFYDIRKDEDRGTVLFQHDEDTVFSPEELIGMIFNNSRHLAEEYAGVPIRDVVITVPPFFNQAQRRSLIHSANLVGLNVLQLMSDNAAAALNYGLFRQASFNTTPQYVMFYDMGAASTTATVVEYRKTQVKEGTLANVHPQLTVKGTGFSRLLGGLEMEIRLQKHFAEVFEAQKKTKGSVYDSPRAMAKLLKEAKRVKQVLSANTDHMAQVEGLLEDVDFRTQVTRAQFEELCSDLLERVGDPVEQALAAADITMDEIDSVILVGGGTRVPKVQENLLKVVNKPELGKSLNTDEAPALGAVYQAAGHTKLFRVKKFIVKEGAVYPIQVSFNRVTPSEVEGEGEVTKMVKRTLFQRSNPFPAKKILTFNRYTSDFAFQVFYGDLGFLSEEEKSYLGRLNISEVYLAGVSSALKEHSQAEPKGIKAHFNMDESGLLNLTNVQFVFEYPEDVKEQSTLSKIGSTITSFFGMGGDDSAEKEAASESDGEEVHADGNETESSSSSDSYVPRTDREPPLEAQREADSEDLDPDSTATTSESESESKADSPPSPEPEAEASASDSEAEPEGASVGGDKEEVVEEEVEEEVEEVVPPSEEEEEEEVGKEETPASEGDKPAPETEGAPEAEETANAEEESESPTVPSNTTAANATADSNTTTNTTSTKKAKAPPTGNVVKVNLTAELTILDLALPEESKFQLSVEKLRLLQLADDNKVANEQAKNALESHVFETKDAMYSEAVMNVSTEEQREVILAALTQAGDWLEDEGYFAETQVYKDKLRELKRVSRAMFKRVSEAVKRPKLLASLVSSLNVSNDFLARMKNLTDDVQIFTKVEITTLEELIIETKEWALKKIEEQEATPPHEEPVLMSHEIEEHIKRLDREVMYLLNKIRSRPPPKVPLNRTNTTTNQTKTNSTEAPEASSTEDSSTEDSSTEDLFTADPVSPVPETEASQAPPTEDTDTETSSTSTTEEPEEVLELPPAADSSSSDQDDDHEEL